MAYLTFEKYNEMGGTLDLTAFNRFNAKAEAIIDDRTYNRLIDMAIIPERVSLLCFELIEMYDNQNKNGAVASRSQSAGTVSESETYISKSLADIEEEMDDLVRTYLSRLSNDKGIPLLYRGCSLD